ncbi:hypothetical protein NA56DRAFT_564534 [Hyaloscypha hepaticicola]|uniref:Rhodopsin domain-containing protein n=1 Tax=Hyaloscypha hepaticicola TaxID=2082293 RepID=A0A2J6QHZ0_9HELO|nr:hypothetical protein NA56DRAFT_564534 [Hyaloscypha hepaticicola]
MRIYVRWILLKMWKIEDWLFVASQIAYTILVSSGLVSAIHGNGQHLANIAPADIPIAMHWFYVGELFYTITAILIRLSIGFYLLRICLFKVHTWIIRITMFIITLLTVMYFLFCTFQCRPVNYFWLQFDGEKGRCSSPLLVQNVSISYAVFAAVTDIIFGILPITVIWNLNMNRKAKMVVGCLLALGIIAGFTVIIRIEYVRLVKISPDFLFAVSNVSIWSMIEPAIGICCMAASTFRPLFSSLRDKPKTYYHSNNPGTHTSSRVHGAGNTFKMSRSMNNKGYLKSIDATGKSDSSEDVLVIEGLQSSRVEVEGGMKGEGAGRHGDEGKGIMFSTTVEITREQKKIHVDDMV